MTAAHHHRLHRYSVHIAALLQSTERTFLSLWVCLVTVCRRSKNSCCCTAVRPYCCRASTTGIPLSAVGTLNVLCFELCRLHTYHDLQL